MLKKSIIILIIFFGLLLTSCYNPMKGNKSENSNDLSEYPSLTGPIIIAGIYKDGSQGWFINEGLSTESKVKEMGADEFIYIDANMNSTTFAEALDSIIAEEVDGVIICIPDQSLSQFTVNKLKKVGIPLIATNDPLVNIAGDKIAPFVGVDDYSLGQMTGDWMANYSIKNGLIDDPSVGVLILTNDSFSNARQRAEGQYDRFIEMIPYYPSDHIYYANYNGETEKGFEAAIDVFSTNNHVAKWLVMASNDEGGIGAVRALEQLGLDKSSAVISIGGYLAKEEFKKEYSALKAASYYSASKIGSVSGESLMNKILYNEAIPKEQLFNAVIITKDNYQEIMGDEAN